MYKILGVCFLSLFLSSGLFAEFQPFLTRSQVIMNDQGIFVNVNGDLHRADTVSHIGNGIFQAFTEPVCRECTLSSLLEVDNCSK